MMGSENDKSAPLATETESLLTLSSDNSEKAMALADQLQQKGYTVNKRLSTDPEPRAVAGFCAANGYKGIFRTFLMEY